MMPLASSFGVFFTWLGNNGSTLEQRIPAVHVYTCVHTRVHTPGLSTTLRGHPMLSTW